VTGSERDASPDEEGDGNPGSKTLTCAGER